MLVLLEVDTPGHSFSWGLARPELTTCDKLEHQRGKNCPEPPCGYMDMKSEARPPTRTRTLTPHPHPSPNP